MFEGRQLNLAGWTKKVTGVPPMTVGLDSDLMDCFVDGRFANCKLANLVRDDRFEELKPYSHAVQAQLHEASEVAEAARTSRMRPDPERRAQASSRTSPALVRTSQRPWP